MTPRTPATPDGHRDSSALPPCDSPPAPPVSRPGAGHVHPWLFCVLMIPFGACSGYASVTLGSLLAKGGVSVMDFAGLMAWSVLPHTWKFIWSPVVDVTLTPKKWYLISALLAATALGLLGAFPAQQSSVKMLSLLMFLSGLATSVVGMSVESLMAHCTSEELKGRAGGWFQAGNLGGSGIGGGLGLLMAVRVPEQWMASGTIALMCAFCCLALAGLPSPGRSVQGHGPLQLVAATLKDVWSAVRVRRGMLALLLCIVPLGIGASSGLWSAIAPEWNTGPDTVAIVTGVLGGIVSALGCLAGGFLCDRFNRHSCYVGFGIAVAVAGMAMALLPRTEPMFILTTLLMSFTAGMSWAGYAAFVLEAIGRGAAATKFSAFASLANMPIWYMTLLNGWSQDKWGTTGMIQFEAAMGVAGALVFLIAAKILLPTRPQQQGANH